MAKSKYDDSSIKSLKGPDRVRLRPSVIFGSDDIVGCCHSFFEILSNSIDEFKEGHGNKIIVSYFNDGSVEVQDFGRGIPVDYNEKEKAYNWELLFCEMYAGGKYGDTYEFSLGLNGLGLCATQYASEYMEAEIYNGKYRYELRFEKGYPVCKNKEEQMHKTEMKHKPGTRIKWRPDLSVFTDINMPLSYFEDTLKKQAICNNGLTILLKYQNPDGSITERTFYYENGISDLSAEITGSGIWTSPQVWSAERFGRDRADKDDYRVILNVAFCFSNKYPFIEYYHNSSFLEYGGSPDKAVKSAFVSAIDSYIKSVGKYNKNESKIAFSDIEDSLALVSNSYSTQTSYENRNQEVYKQQVYSGSYDRFPETSS